MNGLGMYGMRYGARPEDFGAPGTEMPAFMQGQILANQQYAQQQDQQQQMRARQFALQQAEDAADNQQQFNQLASQAYSTAPDQRNTLLGKMAALDPNGAMQQQKAFAALDAGKQAQVQAQLQNIAQKFTAIAQDPDPQRQQQEYNAMIAQAEAAGKDMSMFKNVPPAVGAKMAIAQISDMKGLMGMNGVGAGGQPRVVGNALVGPDGKVLYQGPQAPQWKFDPSSGTMVNTQTGQYRPVQPAGASTPGLDSTVQGTHGAVSFNFPPGTPPEVIAAAKAEAVAHGDIAPQTGDASQPAQPMTLAQYKASNSGKGGGLFGGSENSLTPDAQQLVATAMEQGLKIPIPSVGMGGAARVQTLNGLAADLTKKHIPFDLALQEMRFGLTADPALKKSQGLYSTTKTLEAGADQLAQQALELSKSVGRGQIPLFNEWVNAGRRATSDPNVARLDRAINAFTHDYAKVVSGALGSSAGSDTAIAEAKQQLMASNSPEVFAANVAQMQKEMHVRTDGMLDSIRKQVANAANMGYAPNPNDESAPVPNGIPDASPQGAPQTGPIATNPQTGQRVQWNGTAWVPAQ